MHHTLIIETKTACENLDEHQDRSFGKAMLACTLVMDTVLYPYKDRLTTEMKKKLHQLDS
jgi:hypothetical protein